MKAVYYREYEVHENKEAAKDFLKSRRKEDKNGQEQQD